MEEPSVIFLKLPRPFRTKSFETDPSIPLPVEPGSSAEDLSIETILSGMLKLISVRSGGNNPSEEASASSNSRKGGGKLNSSTKTAAGLAIQPGKIFPLSGAAIIPPEWIDYYRAFVLTVKPEIYHEFTNASIIKAANGEFDMAMEISAILEGLFPGSSGVLLNRALILENKAAAMEKNGHNAENINLEILSAYEKALSMEPVLPDVLFNAGFFFMRLGEYIRAGDCFSLYITAAEEAEKTGEIPSGIPPEKIKQARKIIHEIKSQGLDDPIFQEAYSSVNRGNDEEGLKKMRGFIERHPKVWNGWFVLGWALRKLSRWEDGLEALKKAAELGGLSCDIKNETAICLMELGDLNGARKELENALREEPENIRIISNLGVLAMKSGSGKEAAAFFRTVMELDPNDPLANHFLKQLGVEKKSP